MKTLLLGLLLSMSINTVHAIKLTEIQSIKSLKSRGALTTASSTLSDVETLSNDFNSTYSSTNVNTTLNTTGLNASGGAAFVLGTRNLLRGVFGNTATYTINATTNTAVSTAIGGLPNFISGGKIARGTLTIAVPASVITSLCTSYPNGAAGTDPRLTTTLATSPSTFFTPANVHTMFSNTNTVVRYWG